jgi:arginase family enzyme
MVSTLFVDYPEARRVIEHLGATRGVTPEAAWEPFGTHPETVRANLRPVPDHPFVLVNGSGNYHHETYAVLAGLCRQGPCAYLHIDAHTDKDTVFRWKIDCASFVGAILELPDVTEGVLLGVNVLPKTKERPVVVIGNDVHYYRFDYFTKLRQYYARPMQVQEFHFRYSRADCARARNNPSIERARVTPLPPNHQRKERRGLAVQWRDLAAFDPKSVASEIVYISVDLDVLRRDLVTDWRREGPGGTITDNQGVMTLRQLLALIRRVGRARKVVAADLCGLTERFFELEPAQLERSLETVATVYDALVEVVGVD